MTSTRSNRVLRQELATDQQHFTTKSQYMSLIPSPGSPRITRFVNILNYYAGLTTFFTSFMIVHEEYSSCVIDTTFLLLPSIRNSDLCLPAHEGTAALVQSVCSSGPVHPAPPARHCHIGCVHPGGRSRCRALLAHSMVGACSVRLSLLLRVLCWSMTTMR